MIPKLNVEVICFKCSFVGKHSCVCVCLCVPGGSWDWEYLGFASPEVNRNSYCETFTETLTFFVRLMFWFMPS